MEIDKESNQFIFHLLSWRPNFNCIVSRVAVHGVFHWQILLITGRRLWASDVNPEQTVPDLKKGVSNGPTDDAAQFINLNTHAQNLNDFGENSSALMWG